MRKKIHIAVYEPKDEISLFERTDHLLKIKRDLITKIETSLPADIIKRHTSYSQ